MTDKEKSHKEQKSHISTFCSLWPVFQKDPDYFISAGISVLVIRSILAARSLTLCS
jgi:hypothetical protein